MAAARSRSISRLRRMTVRSSRVIAAIRWVGSATVSATRIEPQRQGERVGVEALGFGEADRRRRERGKTGRVAAHNRRALHEVEDAETGGKAGAARGRQHVVGTGNVIADRF